MLNKKRLAMMAVAASMVLPNNLVYLTTNTPVFAEEAKPAYLDGISEKVIKLFGETNITNATNYSIYLKGGEYTLTEDITATDLSKALLIPTGETVTLNLNDHSITSSAFYTLRVNGGNLILKGTGTITNSSSGWKEVGANLWVDNGNLTVGSSEDTSVISLKAEPVDDAHIYGIAVAAESTTADIKVYNALFETTSGLTVNGSVEESSTIGIELNKVTTDCSASAIYQAGPSTIKVENSLLQGEVSGIESRAGTLTVKNSVVKGNEEDPTIVKSNGDGSTTDNAGIAIAQHTTMLPINVTLENTQVSGTTALAIVDPETPSDLEKVEVTLKDSVLSGNKDTGYDLAYTKAIKSFTADGVTLETTEAPQKVKIDSTDGDKLTSDSEPSEEETKLYVVTPKPADAPNIPLGLPEDSTFDPEKDINEDGTLTDTAKDSVKSDLQNLVNKLSKENTIFEAYTSSGEVEDEVALNYDYTVEDVASKADLLADGTYNFKAQLTAKLNKDNDSLICLVIPYSEEESETVALNEDAPAGTSEDFKLYVTLTTVLDEAESSRLKLSADKIETVLKAINEKRTTAGDTLIQYSSNDLTKFEALDLDRSYPIQQINTPIEITVEDDKYQAPTKQPTGNSSKPKPKPEEPMEPVVGTPTTMYRLYNRLTGEHLYTIDKNERDNLLTSDTWKDEGEGWIAPSESAYPVYRLLNPNNSDHHYTTDKNEFDTLPSYGWIAEGIAFFSADKDNPENVILYRLYNPNAEGAGSHHYTVDANERDTLVGLGWTYEGLAWAGLPANK